MREWLGGHLAAAKVSPPQPHSRLTPQSALQPSTRGFSAAAPLHCRNSVHCIYALLLTSSM